MSAASVGEALLAKGSSAVRCPLGRFRFSCASIGSGQIRAWGTRLKKIENRQANEEYFHSQYIAPRGTCGKAQTVPHSCQPKREIYGNGRHEMRVSLSLCGSRDDAESMAGRAVRLRAAGAPLRLIGVWR